MVECDYGIRRSGEIVSTFTSEANAIGECRRDGGTVIFLPTDTPIWQHGHGWIDKWNPVNSGEQSE